MALKNSPHPERAPEGCVSKGAVSPSDRYGTNLNESCCRSRPSSPSGTRECSRACTSRRRRGERPRFRVGRGRHRVSQEPRDPGRALGGDDERARPSPLRTARLRDLRSRSLRPQARRPVPRRAPDDPLPRAAARLDGPQAAIRRLAMSFRISPAASGMLVPGP